MSECLTHSVSLGAHMIWDSDEEPLDITPKPHPRYDVHLTRNVPHDAKASATTVLAEVSAVEASDAKASSVVDKRGEVGSSRRETALLADDRSTSAGDDSSEAVPKNKSSRCRRKDSLSHRRRYRKVVDDILGEMVAAPGFRVDWRVVPESIANDAWLMNKLRKRIEKHREDLLNNIVSL